MVSGMSGKPDEMLGGNCFETRSFLGGSYGLSTDQFTYQFAPSHRKNSNDNGSVFYINILAYT